MRHAVLGAGGVGALLAAALARGDGSSGADVTLLMRPASLAGNSGVVRVSSAVLGDFEQAVAAAAALDGPVDVLWVTPKATDLDTALHAVPPDAVGDAVVVPLLNGVDHLAALRDRYPRVVAGAIRVESERARGQDGAADGALAVRQTSPFVRVDMAPAAGLDGVAADLRAAGLDVRLLDDDLTLLWDKLIFLAPVALATTALDGTLGEVRDDERFLAVQAEAVLVARAEGAAVDAEAAHALHRNAPGGMRSSMQKDVAAGRPPELDGIAGPILRGGARHGIPVPGTRALADLVAARAAAPDAAVG
jgi:2-dehydropantoate 2-reductase